MVEFSLEEEALDELSLLTDKEDFSLDNSLVPENSSLDEYLKKPEFTEYYQKTNEEQRQDIISYELEFLSLDADFKEEPYSPTTYLSEHEESDNYQNSSGDIEVSYEDQLDYSVYIQQYSLERTPGIEAPTLYGITEEMDEFQTSRVLFAEEREKEQIATENNLYFSATVGQFCTY